MKGDPCGSGLEEKLVGHEVLAVKQVWDPNIFNECFGSGSGKEGVKFRDYKKETVMLNSFTQLMASHWSRKVKEFPPSVIADCGIFEYDDRKDYDTTELRNSYRKKTKISHRGKWWVWILKIIHWKRCQHTRILWRYWEGDMAIHGELETSAPSLWLRSGEGMNSEGHV